MTQQKLKTFVQKEDHSEMEALIRELWPEQWAEILANMPRDSEIAEEFLSVFRKKYQQNLRRRAKAS